MNDGLDSLRELFTFSNPTVRRVRKARQPRRWYVEDWIDDRWRLVTPRFADPKDLATYILEHRNEIDETLPVIQAWNNRGNGFSHEQADFLAKWGQK